MDVMSFSITISIYSTDRLMYLQKSLDILLKDIDLVEEIIIVCGDKDNKENTKQIMNYLEKEYHNHKIYFIPNNGNGLSHARNTAMNFTKAMYLAYLDDDAIPRSNWARKISNIIQSDYEIFGGKIVPYYLYDGFKIPDVLNWIYGCTFPPVYSKNTSHEVRNPIGANMILNVKILREIGGFSVNFGRKGTQLFGAEETQVALKFHNFGYKTLYDPGIVVNHIVPTERMNINYIFRRSYYEGVTKAIFKGVKLDIESSSNNIELEHRYLHYLIMQLLDFRLFKSSFHIIISIIFVSIGFVKTSISITEIGS